MISSLIEDLFIPFTYAQVEDVEDDLTVVFRQRSRKFPEVFSDVVYGVAEQDQWTAFISENNARYTFHSCCCGGKQCVHMHLLSHGSFQYSDDCRIMERLLLDAVHFRVALKG